MCVCVYLHPFYSHTKIVNSTARRGVSLQLCSQTRDGFSKSAADSFIFLLQQGNAVVCSCSTDWYFPLRLLTANKNRHLWHHQIFSTPRVSRTVNSGIPESWETNAAGKLFHFSWNVWSQIGAIQFIIFLGSDFWRGMCKQKEMKQCDGLGGNTGYSRLSLALAGKCKQYGRVKRVGVISWKFQKCF